MKAIILAAGKGSRLRNIAGEIPKPMIIYNGKPILEHNIDLCRKYDVKDILINTHYLSEQITGYFGDGARFGVKISYSSEPELLGTSGALNNFRKEIGDEHFFVVYGDNFSEIDLEGLGSNFREHLPMASVAFHYREDTSHSGVAEFEANDKIVRFIEKPKPGETDSHWVSSGVYMLNNKILSYIPEGFSDFGKDIFPKLMENGLSMFGVRQHSEVMAFDTPEMYRKTMYSKTN